MSGNIFYKSKKMDQADMRWKQRSGNYTKAFTRLSRFIEKGNLNELEEQGLID